MCRDDLGAEPCKVGCHICANNVLPSGSMAELKASSSEVPKQQERALVVKQVGSPGLSTKPPRRRCKADLAVLASVQCAAAQLHGSAVTSAVTECTATSASAVDLR